MIELENVVKSYGNHRVLDGLSLRVKKGEVYGFIGQNGSGKSTTMNILSGLIGIQEGECRIGASRVKVGSHSARQIGYLPEGPSFYPFMNGWEYLSFIGTLAGDSGTRIKRRSRELLDLVKLSDAAKRPIGNYSRGMKQRLGIAVAMYKDPKVLLFDEPSSALDPEGRLDVMDIILSLKSAEKTIFLSTHILNDIERICDRVGILHRGALVLEDDLAKLMTSFIEPVYDIELDQPIGEGDLESLRDADYIGELTIDKNKISVRVDDYKASGGRLLEQLGSLNLPVISVKLRKSSLEVIFLKEVK